MIVTGDAKIFAAFVKARAEIGATVTKDAKGNFGKYATLAALTEATAAPMAKHGLAVVQEASVDEFGATVETWLVHEAGGMMQFAPLTLPVEKRSAQAVGSALTYCRRYALAAICGIAPEDDDGQAATDAPGKPQERGQGYQARNTTRAAAAPRVAAPEPPSDVDMGMGGNPFEEPTTDEEHALINGWAKFGDAYAWAVQNGACANNFEAKTSMNKIVEAHGGYNKETRVAIMTAFIRRQREKLAAQQQQPAANGAAHTTGA